MNREGKAAGQIPELDSGDLLRELRRRTGRPELEFSEPPKLLGQGGEARVDGFRLSKAPPELDGPLVLRRLAVDRDPREVELERAVHAALAAQGFPVPRVLLVGTDPAPLGSPYLVSERLHGRALLQEVHRPDQLLAHPTRLPGLVGEALFRVPKLLGEVQARLHALDAATFRDDVAKAGVDATRMGYPARLDRVASLIQEHHLSGLAPGLEWLRRHAPESTSEVVCHGDLVFTNLFVDDGAVTGVFDWSCVAVADPAYDMAATLIRLESRIPGVPRVLGPLFRAAQKRLARGYQRSYRLQRSIDAKRVHYFDAFWTLYELTGSGVNLRQGARPVAEVEGRWLHPETIHFGVERFRARTGIELAPLQADESSA